MNRFRIAQDRRDEINELRAILKRGDIDPYHRARIEAIINGTPEPPPPVEEIFFSAACNGRPKQAIHMLESGAVSIQKLEAVDGLHTIIAHSSTHCALYMVEHARHLGLDIDRRDSFALSDTNRLGNTLDARGIDWHDRLGWQDGSLLRHTPLILSLKKGWDRAVFVRTKDGQDYRESQHVPAHVRMNTPRMGRVAMALLRAGADPDIQDGCGNTALHIAALHREVRAINALRAAGADKTLRNNAGLRPIDMLRVPYEDILPFLYQQTGGDVNCYIFTIKSRRDWLAAGAAARDTLIHWPRCKPAPGL